MSSKPARSVAQTRSTKQRSLIVNALESASGFLSAQDLHFTMTKKGQKVGLATVYRNLQLLADSGEVDVLHTREGETLYRRCASGDHHHHLVCRKCGRSVEVIGEEVEKWATRMGRRYGYDEVTHTAELFGVCGDCHSR